MSVYGIRNLNPQSFRRDWYSFSGLLGKAIRFTAGRFTANRPPADPQRLGYNVGKEHQPHVEVRETAPAKKFFEAQGLSGSRKYVINTFQKDDQGKITNMRWVTIGKFRGFYWSYLKPLLTGRNLDKVIRARRVSSDELEVTYFHRGGPVHLPDIQVPHMEWKDRVEIINGGNTLRVHYREKNLQQPDGSYRSLGFQDLDISRYGLQKYFEKGGNEIYQNQDDETDPHRVQLFSKRIRVLERAPAPEGLGEDTVISRFEERFYLYTTVSSRETLKIENLKLPENFDAAIIRARSAINVKHLTEQNGRAVGQEEWLPFNREIDHFPAMFKTISRAFFVQELGLSGENLEKVLTALFKNPDKENLVFKIMNKKELKMVLAQLVDSKVIDPKQEKQLRELFLREVIEPNKWTTHLYPGGDPRTNFGTGIKDGKIGTCVTDQQFAPQRPEMESQIWLFDDQQGFFGGERRSFLGFGYGDMEGREAPWFMPEGRHSLQYGKFVNWAAIFTGSNGMDRAVWIERLFQAEDVEFDEPFWSQLMHLITITEDAQGAHEKALAFDERTMYDPEVKSIAATIETIKVGSTQRRRWAAMIGYFLSWAFKYLKDEVIRCRLYGRLAYLPLVGKVFERKRIPHVYTDAQIHEWMNTGSWYLDAVCKFVFAVTPALYIVFGLTPLIATLPFFVFWLIKTIMGWPSYGYQTAKVGVSPRRTLFPFPRDIFYWFFYTPQIARGDLHIEDEGVGPFASSAQTRGANMEPSSKKLVFWFYTALPVYTAYEGFKVLYLLAFAGKAAVAATLAGAFWPLGLAIGLSILWRNVCERIWPGERAKFYQSVIKFIPPFVGIAYAVFLASGAITAAAFPGFFLVGLFMNAIWSAYLASGMLWGWIRYLKDQDLYSRFKGERNVDRIWNVIREISFLDVLRRDKFRMFTPNGIRQGLRETFRDFVYGWRSS